MKKNIYIALLLIILMSTLSGCGQKINSTGELDANENNSVEDEGEEITASTLEMLERGKPLHCTFSFKDEKETMEQTGEFYVDGQKKRFKMDATAIVKGENPMTIKSAVVSDGEYTYSWNSLNEKAGFKMKMEEAVETDSTDEQKVQDLNQDIKFHCRSWKVDNSVFDLPSGITFTDMNEMIKNMTPPSASGNVDICALCNQIPDVSQKSECQKANCK